MGSLSAASKKALAAIKKQQRESDDLAKKGHDALNDARQLADPAAAKKKRDEGVKLIEESLRVGRRVVGKMEAENAIGAATSLAAALKAIDAEIERELADAKKHGDKGTSLFDDYKKVGDPKKLEEGHDELEEYVSALAEIEGKHEIREIVDAETK